MDPGKALVTVLMLVDKLYEGMEYQHRELIVSPTFPVLQLTAEQIFQTGQ